jgi:hypothetical protein
MCTRCNDAVSFDFVERSEQVREIEISHESPRT